LTRTTLPHSPGIRIILQCKNNKHQNRTRNELAKELTSFRHKWLRISTEYPRRGSRARWYSTDSMSFEVVDPVDVVRVYDARGGESPEELREQVDGEAAPGEFAEEAEAEGYCWVEEPA